MDRRPLVSSCPYLPPHASSARWRESSSRSPARSQQFYRYQLPESNRPVPLPMGPWLSGFEPVLAETCTSFRRCPLLAPTAFCRIIKCQRTFRLPSPSSSQYHYNKRQGESQIAAFFFTLSLSVAQKVSQAPLLVMPLCYMRAGATSSITDDQFTLSSLWPGHLRSMLRLSRFRRALSLLLFLLVVLNEIVNLVFCNVTPRRPVAALRHFIKPLPVDSFLIGLAKRKIRLLQKLELRFIAVFKYGNNLIFQVGLMIC